MSSHLTIAEPPEHSPEVVLAALEQAVRDRIADGLPTGYFEAAYAWRRVILNHGWRPGFDLGQGAEYLVQITHPGAPNVTISLDTAPAATEVSA